MRGEGKGDMKGRPGQKVRTGDRAGGSGEGWGFQNPRTRERMWPLLDQDGRRCHRECKGEGRVANLPYRIL